MINSFLNNTKTIENYSKNNHINYISNRERRFNNGKNDTYILRNIRQKNDYNNHRFYSNNDHDENKISNLSEMYSKNRRWDLYKSDSKNKNEENKNINERLSFKTKNHNYHHINTAYHSYDKNQKVYGQNTYENQNLNNIKIIEREIYTPRANNKNKCLMNNPKNVDLSKTFYNFKNRDNYGYHEIKDVKKNNDNQKNNINTINNTNKNNTERKNVPKKQSNYLSINISNNNSFRRSLNIYNNITTNNNANNINNSNNANITNINNTCTSNIANNYIKNYNMNQKNQNQEQNNNNAPNKNSNIRKYSFLNFKTAQNYFNPPKKNIIAEESNYSSYKNIKAPQKNNKIEISKNNDNNKNLNKSLLIKKIYLKKTPKEKKTQNGNGCHVNFVKRNDIKNNNPNCLNKENDKNVINSYRFLSGDLKAMVKEDKSEKDANKTINTENKLNNSKLLQKKLNKVYSPIRKINAKILSHIKQSSCSNYNNYNTNSTEKKDLKANGKYEINHIFKKVEKMKINKVPSSRNNKNELNNEEKIPKALRINEKVIKVIQNYKDNTSIILKKNQSYKRIEDKNKDNNEKEVKQKEEINKIKANTNTNIKNGRNYEQKDNKNLDKNIFKSQQNSGAINNLYIKRSNKYNNPFNKDSNSIRKDLTDEKNKNKFKNIIKKKCRSIEKNDNKNENIKKVIEVVKKHSSRSKTKSKAKKHSNKIKYLDKLKIFKYRETNYNIYYESSTNCSKDNPDYKYKIYAIKATKSNSKKKKNINSFNLNYKTFEEDFKLSQDNINEKYQNLKPQISVRITLTKKNNVNIVGILRYFKVNYFCSENLRNKYDYDSEDTSEFYNAKF